jgi:hypothetical protein
VAKDKDINKKGEKGLKEKQATPTDFQKICGCRLLF